MPHENPFSFGAGASTLDSRTVNYEPALAALYTEGGVDYLLEEILHQHKVGICTAIHLVQERQKANSKKYSADFQYLLQKKFYDGNWDEGSSILHALKVGKKYGFLPSHKWIYTTEADRMLPYSQYIAKLRAVPESAIQKLLTECVDKIDGYAQVDVHSPTAIARAISESKAGILCRYAVGSEWWTPPIEPLRSPQTIISGHAIIMSRFNYLVSIFQLLVNTWGKFWAGDGKAIVNWGTYRPTEAWIVVNKVYFLKDLKLGMTDPDVLLLQKFLNNHGFPVAEAGAGSPGNETNYFGTRTKNAVIAFQIANNIQPAVGYFGLISRTRANATA